jgi:uncharacterized protein YndB with AHSA1/START domain
MTTSDFTTTLLVDQTPKEVFRAINNVRGWWSEEIEGSTDKLNDEFTYQYKDVHHCRMKLIEIVPEKKVAWLVLDNYFNFTKDKSEWNGTKINFEISKQNNKTQIRFTHLGLVPQYECFDICSNAWSKYIQQSLLSLITTGKGQPNLKNIERKEIHLKDYQKSFTVNKPINEVYGAITENISDWWSNDLTGAAARADDSFTISFDRTRKTMNIIEAIPNRRVVWKCVKAYIDMPSLKNKAEWVGTTLIWTFTADNRDTTITFLHEGLNKSFECYEVCEDGWNTFLASLKAFLTTGNGTPFLKAEGKKKRSVI